MSQPPPEGQQSSVGSVLEQDHERASGPMAPIPVLPREHGRISDLLDTLETGVGDGARR